jgi:endonuclease/exonuclease/phosphatase family metal-dependent hydrolase
MEKNNFAKRSKPGFPAILALLGMLLSSCTGCSNGNTGYGREIAIMSWNVQNLFDARLDGTEYSEFMPSSGWSIDDYRSRLASTAEVIRSAVKNGPDIVFLQEVEHAGVLHDLEDPYLRGLGYHYRVASDGEGSATQVGVLSRFPLVSVVSRAVHLPGAPLMRPVLEVTVELADEVFFTAFVCHWKSKYGGAAYSEPFRVAAAAMIRNRVKMLKTNGAVALMVLGDLNIQWDEYLLIDGSYETALFPFSSGEASLTGLSVTTLREEAGLGGDGLPLFTPWGEYLPEVGTYSYRNSWERIDHFLFSSTFFDGKGIEYAGFEVAMDGPWFNPAGYPQSYIMSNGYGYSDHLPIIAYITLVSDK